MESQRDRTRSKCTVIGCGFVGAACANALMTEALFKELVLIDINRARAAGEAMDISHGMAFSGPQRITAGTWEDMRDSACVVITAGANQTGGESRLALAERNIRILESILPHVRDFAPDAILLIVSNPVDLLTRRAVQWFGYDKPGHERETGRIIGSGTVLDTGRLRWLLSEHFGIDNRNIHAFVIGEHGDSEFAVWSGANVSGIDMQDYCRIAEPSHSMREVKELLYEVRDSAYRIIEAKGATYYGIAMAVLRILRAVMRDEKSVLTVSAYLHGEYGIRDAAIGVPAVIGRNGAERILEIPLNAEERQQLSASVRALYPELAGEAEPLFV